MRRSGSGRKRKSSVRLIRLLQGCAILADGLNRLGEQRRQLLTLQECLGSRTARGRFDWKLMAREFGAWSAAEAILKPALPLSHEKALHELTVSRFSRLTARTPAPSATLTTIDVSL